MPQREMVHEFMNTTKRLICLFLLICSAATYLGASMLNNAPRIKYPGGKCYMYRFALKDKQGTRYNLHQPQRFLSRKAIERRKRQDLPLDSTDLPVSDRYLNLFRNAGAKITGTSKWNNTVLVWTREPSAAVRLAQLPCVAGCRLVWESPDSIIPSAEKIKIHRNFNQWDTISTDRYAAASEQIGMLKGLPLHEQGYRGRGMTIAVLDGGFKNADRIPAFKKTNIAGTHDFVYPASPSIYYETDHGTKVLSAMAVSVPNIYIGTAPEAAYWLLRCEDQESEQMVEEDYWAMAAEFADSAGVDIINSSLGYNEFDDHTTDHKYYEMDGLSTLISRSASMLAQKGIILVCSAGNSGMGPWKKITFPADAKDCLAVGAVTADGRNAPFSGVGPTQDGRIKPDVMAPGSPTSLISGRGTLVQDIGTSFAAPLVCGLAACLWQALPGRTAAEIMQLIRRSGDNHIHPDNIYGYGVPDFGKAYLLGTASQPAAPAEQSPTQISLSYDQ